MTAGDIYTVAGNGTAGFSGDGGPATGAELQNPRGHRGRRRREPGDRATRTTTGSESSPDSTGTFYGQAMTTGDIYTDRRQRHPSASPAGGGPATSAELDFPTGVAVDGTGSLLIADAGDYRVRAVAAASGTFYGRAMTAGDVYASASTGIQGFSGDGGPATSARIGLPLRRDGGRRGQPGAVRFLISVRVVADSTGTFYGQAMTVSDIYTVAGDGYQGFSGDGGPAISAELGGPGKVAVDAAGNLVIPDATNQPGPGGRRTAPAAFYGQAMTTGDIYTVAGRCPPRASPETAAQPRRPSSTARRRWRWTRRATW